MMYDVMIYNGSIFDGTHFIQESAVLIVGGKICKILRESEVESFKQYTEKCIDAQKNIIMPGMLDLQLNGCGGVLFNDEQTIDVLKTMNQTNIRYGCTRFLPTLITSGDEKIKEALKCVDEACEKGVAGVVGIHLEGPMISKVKKGIHQEHLIHVLNQTMLETLGEYQEIIKMITLAPECVDYDVLEVLQNQKLPLSIGHSNASYEECAEKGSFFTHATHLWNAMSPLEGRAPGVVGYVLDQSRLYTGIIADGHHVKASNIRLATKMHPDTLYVTTDAVTPAGRDDIESFIFEGNLVYVEDGMCKNKEGQLGGANVTMVESLRYLIEEVGIAVEHALKMATSIPANAIYEKNRYGHLKEGNIADVVIFNKNEYTIQMTIQNGEVVYKA